MAQLMEPLIGSQAAWMSEVQQLYAENRQLRQQHAAPNVFVPAAAMAKPVDALPAGLAANTPHKPLQPLVDNRGLVRSPDVFGAKADFRRWARRGGKPRSARRLKKHDLCWRP